MSEVETINPAAELRRMSQERLAQLEATIHQGLTTFIEVGRALAEIMEFKLYLLAGFKTFNDYTTERIGISRSGAVHKIDAAKVVDLLAAESLPPPTSEMQARALAPLLNSPG